jgi:hypothetical protein
MCWLWMEWYDVWNLLFIREDNDCMLVIRIVLFTWYKVYCISYNLQYGIESLHVYYLNHNGIRRSNQ